MLALLKCAAHLRRALLEVHIIPKQPEQLPTPKTGGNGDDVESLVAVVRSRCEQLPPVRG